MSSSEPGSLSEEVLRLVETLQGWLATGTAMGGVGSASECRVCPVCQLIGMLGGAHPEVLAHLVEAGTSLAAALRAATEATAAAGQSGRRPPVQHIDVT